MAVWRLFAQFAPLPVFMKETRSRMRGARTPLIVFAVTIFTCFVGVLVMTPRWPEPSSDPVEMHRVLAEIGPQGLAAVCVRPRPRGGGGGRGGGGASFSLERERQSFDLLLLTPLTNANLAAGKLLSAVSFVGLLNLCALPLMGLAFYLGGVSPGQFLYGEALLLATFLAVGAVSVYASTWFLRTSGTVLLAYGAAFVWLVGVPLLLAIEGESSLDGLAMSLFLALWLFPLGMLVSHLTALPVARLLRREASTTFALLLTIAYTLAVMLLTASLFYITVGNEPALTGYAHVAEMGHPLFALLDAFGQLHHQSVYLSNGGTLQWESWGYPLCAFVLQLGIAILFFVLACRRLARMRRGGDA
jgi:hypothetical protein